MSEIDQAFIKAYQEARATPPSQTPCSARTDYLIAAGEQKRSASMRRT